MDDRKILELLWNRVESAIDALGAKFGRRLHLMAMNILNDYHDAEESVNDTYLALWDSIPPASPDPLAPYVFKVGRNTALRLLRARTAQKRDNRYDVALDELSPFLPGGCLEDHWDARELGQAIDRFLSTADKENRILFIRRYWFGDDISQLAKDRIMSQGTVSVRLYRIRSKLKEFLQEEGFFL